MNDLLPILAIAFLQLIALFILIVLARRPAKPDNTELLLRLDALEKAEEKTEQTVRDELSLNREEFSKTAREQRQEIKDAFKTFGDSVMQRILDVAQFQKGKLDDFSSNLALFAKASGERLDGVRSETATGARQLREEVINTLKALSETIRQSMNETAEVQKTQLDGFSIQLNSFAQSSGERLDKVRTESGLSAKHLREEVVATLKTVSDTMSETLRDLSVAQKTQLEGFSAQIALLTKTSEEKLDGIRTESGTGARELRKEVISALKGIAETTTKTMGELSSIQKTQLETMSNVISKLSDKNEKKLEDLRSTVEVRLQTMHAENARQLDQMRQTVDEKLQGTLEKRLGESFKQVSERLEQVHKGLGEMQSLATGVGDLKKVLTNVKTRGTWGEVQLGVLLEQILNSDQFSTNVATQEGGERVEFAIKLPGQNTDRDETVWLPIDAKFPIEDYHRLLEAQEAGDIGRVDSMGKQLENRVKGCAKMICDKYLNPPKTTDFGILFLPIEGLFAEVIRRTGLTEAIQRECRVVIAGPTTLWAILSSLQMGFRTLAIQKRSSEVWKLLAAVKTEWASYGEILETVQKKLHQASDSIEKAKVRSRAVGRKLRDVEELPAVEAASLLPPGISADE